MRLVVTFAILLNLIAVVACGWFWLHTTMLGSISVAGRYVALDRAGVINEERLAETFPNLAANPRYLVPRWMTEPVVGSAQALGWCGFVVALLNLSGVLLLRRSLLAVASASQPDE